MIVEIIKNNSDFKDLKTAVCYSRRGSGREFKYIPTVGKKTRVIGDLSNHGSNYAMYLGNNEVLSNNDFIQYNFSYFIDKYKFKDGLMINQLDNESRDIIGLDSTVLTAIEERLCPSAIDDSTPTNFDYFGSSIFGKQKFISIDLMEDIYKVELYEEVIETNHNLLNTEKYTWAKFYEYGIFNCLKSDPDISISENNYTDKPALIITLGPEKNLKNNDTSWYYKEEKSIPQESLDLMPAQYRKLEEEILFKKTLNIYLYNKLNLLSKEIPPLEVTLESWQADNKNPNRNSYKNLLRNNEFYGMINNIRPVKQTKYNLRYDVNSMTLVSNTNLTPIENCPILNSKKITSNYWNPKIRYKKGDIVNLIDNEENISWTSLVSNNIGNNPLLSSCWEETDNLTNYFTNKLGIYFDETKYKNTGIIKPSNSIIITGETDYLEINAIPLVGFDIDVESITVYPEYNGNTKIKMTYEEDGVTKYNYYHYITQDLGHIIVFKDRQIELLREVEYVYFNNKPKSFSINFKILLDNELEFSWTKWCNNNENIEVNLNDDTVLNGKNTSITAVTRDYLKNIRLNDTNLYSLIGIKTSSGDEILAKNNIVESLQILPTIKEDINKEITYTLLLKSSVFLLSVTEFYGFIVENTVQKIKPNNSGKIRFYMEDESDNDFEIVIDDGETKLTMGIGNPSTEEFGGVKLYEDGEKIYSLDFEKIGTNIDIKILKNNDNK